MISTCHSPARSSRTSLRLSKLLRFCLCLLRAPDSPRILPARCVSVCAYLEARDTRCVRMFGKLASVEAIGRWTESSKTLHQIVSAALRIVSAALPLAQGHTAREHTLRDSGSSAHAPRVTGRVGAGGAWWWGPHVGVKRARAFACSRPGCACAGVLWAHVCRRLVPARR